MLTTRLMAAAAIVIPVLALFWVDQHYSYGWPGIWVIPLGLVVCWAIATEFCQLLSQQTYRPRQWTVLVGTTVILVGVTLAYWLQPRSAFVRTLAPGEWSALITVGVLAGVLVEEMLRYQAPGGVVERLSLTFWAIFYSGQLLSYLFALRLGRPDASGLFALFSVVCVTKCADAGAYFVGKSFGRHRMTPLLSPKKTWEGAAGGLVAAVLAAWAVDWYLKPTWLGDRPAASWGVLVLYGVTLALAGMLGDLAESLVKRDCQQKDSSHWLPGLGGTLDIFDSLLFAGPVGWLWWSTTVFGH